MSEPALPSRPGSATGAATGAAAGLADDGFETLFEFLPIGAYRSLPGGRLLRANPALVQLNGYASEAEMLHAVKDIGREWYADERRRADFRRALEHDGHVRGFVSEIHRHRTRERIWVRENAHRVCDAAGRTLFYEGTVEEVTAQVHSEQALQRSEQHLREVAQQLPGMLYRAHYRDLGHGMQLFRYSFVSDGVAALYGVTAAEVLADPGRLRRFRHADDTARVDAQVAQALAAREPLLVEYRIVRDDGSQRWVQMNSSALPDDGSGEQQRVGLMLDVTGPHAAREALQRSEARWKLALDSVGDGVWELDLVSGRGELSPRCQQIHGVSDPLHPVDAVTHPDDVPRMLADRQAHIEGRTPAYINEHRIRHSDGSWRWILSRGLVIERDASGRALRMIGTHTDITERRQAEALRRERDAAAAGQRATNDFLSRVSHELRTPLNAVLGFTELMELDAQTPPQHGPWLREVMAAGQHLLALVDDILDISSSRSGGMQLAPQSFALTPLLDECVAMVQTAAQARGITIERPAQAPTLVADRRRTKQILTNLLSNAVKYNRDGGQVRLQVQADEQTLRLAVHDSGPGLDADALQRLFRPFERLQAERRGEPGTGLGLALSRELARAMGGDIVADGAPGQGCVFTLRLPLVSQPAAGHGDQA